MAGANLKLNQRIFSNEDNIIHCKVKTYKVTHWLKERDKILLGPKENLRNVSVVVSKSAKYFFSINYNYFQVVHTLWMPGHTPDHIILHYPIDNRLFLGDIFYRFADINFTWATVFFVILLLFFSDHLKKYLFVVTNSLN